MASHRELEEFVLVRHARSGGQAAFELLVERYDRRLLYYVRRLLGESRLDAAFDVMQSTWLQVHRRLPGLKSPEAFRVWIYRIAHDQAISELRRQGLRPTPKEVDSFDVPDARSESMQDNFDNVELVHRSFGQLTLEHRQVLTLHFLEEMSVEQIAEVTGVPTGTVKSRLYYARVALRSLLGELKDG